MKSFRPKGEPKKPDDSNGWSDFKGQKRSNDTHESKTDPEAKLLRKKQGQRLEAAFWNARQHGQPQWAVRHARRASSCWQN